MKRSQRPSTRAPRRQKRQVFVAYSYRLYPKADYRTVFKNIEGRYQVTFIFADEKITNMHILKKIESFIRDSDFSIFDISGWNPNVTLELGFAMALNDKWYIAIDPSKTDVAEVPSDLRGLDRIQYASYTELGEKIQTIMEQRYPKRPAGTSIDTYLAEQRRDLVGLLRDDNPGLTVTSMAQLLGVDVQVTQLIVRPLVEDGVLRTEGSRRATKYYLVTASAPDVASRGSARSLRRPTQAIPVQPKLLPPAEADADVELNAKEQAVLALLRRRRTQLHLEEIGATCFRNQPAEKANSWARNSLRKLMEHNLVTRTGPGIYAAVNSAAARNQE